MSAGVATPKREGSRFVLAVGKRLVKKFAPDLAVLYQKPEHCELQVLSSKVETDGVLVQSFQLSVVKSGIKLCTMSVLVNCEDTKMRGWVMLRFADGRLPVVHNRPVRFVRCWRDEKGLNFMYY